MFRYFLLFLLVFFWHSGISLRAFRRTLGLRGGGGNKVGSIELNNDITDNLYFSLITSFALISVLYLYFM
jgi:hypothetical protein